MTIHYEPYRENVERVMERRTHIGWIGVCQRCSWEGRMRKSWEHARDDAEAHSGRENHLTDDDLRDDRLENRGEDEPADAREAR